LYSFAGGPDGQSPQAPLIQDTSGNLYGTTLAGGATSVSCSTLGCGTVFELTAMPLAAPPIITSISPTSGLQGTTFDLTVTGNNYQPGATLSFSGLGIVVNGYSSRTVTQIVASI